MNVCEYICICLCMFFLFVVLCFLAHQWEILSTKMFFFYEALISQTSSLQVVEANTKEWPRHPSKRRQQANFVQVNLGQHHKEKDWHLIHLFTYDACIVSWRICFMMNFAIFNWYQSVRFSICFLGSLGGQCATACWNSADEIGSSHATASKPLQSMSNHLVQIWFVASFSCLCYNVLGIAWYRHHSWPDKIVRTDMDNFVILWYFVQNGWASWCALMHAFCINHIPTTVYGLVSGPYATCKCQQLVGRLSTGSSGSPPGCDL